MNNRLHAEDVVDRWETIENESMREGHRYTLVNLIESVLDKSNQKMSKRAKIKLIILGIILSPIIYHLYLDHQSLHGLINHYIKLYEEKKK